MGLTEINEKCNCDLIPVNISNHAFIRRFICSKGTCFYDVWYYFLDEQWIKYDDMTKLQKQKIFDLVSSENR